MPRPVVKPKNTNRTFNIEIDLDLIDFMMDEMNMDFDDLVRDLMNVAKIQIMKCVKDELYPNGRNNED